MIAEVPRLSRSKRAKNDPIPCGQNSSFNLNLDFDRIGISNPFIHSFDLLKVRIYGMSYHLSIYAILYYTDQ